MSWELPPVAVCSHCGSYLSTHIAHLISSACRRSYDGEPCPGTYESTRGLGHWTRCRPHSADDCEDCRGTGWVFVAIGVEIEE
jgi:hypothetical protein